MAGLIDTALAAMALDPALYRAAASGGYLDDALALLLLAGLASGLSQIMVLFVNRVPPRRFLLALIGGTALFLFGMLAWAGGIAAALWLMGLERPPPGTILTLLGLAHAPLLLAPLGIVPHIGLAWLKLVEFWVAVAVAAALAGGLSAPFWLAAAVALVGWLLIRLAAALADPVLARVAADAQRLVTGDILAPAASISAELQRRAAPRPPAGSA